jgi:hypothetical protein
MSQYKHTQIGYFLLTVYGAVIFIIISLFIFTDYKQLAIVGLIIILIALGVFAVMTVKVSDEKMKIQFGLGAIRKEFLIRDIESFREVKHPWYYGWGIRYTPRGWIFRVSGNSGIELQMKSGKLYQVGTDEPQKLAEALNQALNGSHKNHT